MTDFRDKKQSPSDKINENMMVVQDETINLRQLKKKMLKQIAKYYGYYCGKHTYNRNQIIDFLLGIRRKALLHQKIKDGSEDCIICMDVLNLSNTIILNCGHPYCKICIFHYITTENESCPLCRTQYTYEDVIQNIDENELEEILFFVTKYKKSIQQEELVEEDEGDEGDEAEEDEISTTPRNYRFYTFFIQSIIRLRKITILFIKLFLYYKSIAFLCEFLLEINESSYYNYEYGYSNDTCELMLDR